MRGKTVNVKLTRRGRFLNGSEATSQKSVMKKQHKVWRPQKTRQGGKRSQTVTKKENKTGRSHETRLSDE